MLLTSWWSTLFLGGKWYALKMFLLKIMIIYIGFSAVWYKEDPCMDYLPTWKVKNGHLNKGKWLGKYCHPWIMEHLGYSSCTHRQLQTKLLYNWDVPIKCIIYLTTILEIHPSFHGTMTMWGRIASKQITVWLKLAELPCIAHWIQAIYKLTSANNLPPPPLPMGKSECTAFSRKPFDNQQCPEANGSPFYMDKYYAPYTSYNGILTVN